MTNSRNLEIAVGGFIAVGIAALFFLAMQVSNFGGLRSTDTYEVTARFENIGSLKPKAPVTMAGVEVGRVTSIGFDERDFRAVVKLNLYSEYGAIPDDSFAKILTAGLLGEQYIGLEPGGSEHNLKQGSEIVLTQSALVLEELIGQFLFGKAQEGLEK
jgi:phospholipid/cholesterol/gamma-HCH transport system substrate-binding protein